MSQYRWGTMMNDYVYLENVGRRVGNWGVEIARGGFNRGKGKGHRQGKSKRELLQVELDLLHITMNLLSEGMERRKLNQSYWDYK
jgi:hypothetical protein